MGRTLIVFLALCMSTSVAADENLYVCEATHASELGESGELENSNFAKAVVMHQARFAVDRKTGVVAGGPFATADATDGRILSSGTDQEAMKIVWLSNAPYNNLKYLWVRSYAKGAKKPFLGVTGNMIVTGTCE